MVWWSLEGGRDGVVISFCPLLQLSCILKGQPMVCVVKMCLPSLEAHLHPRTSGNSYRADRKSQPGPNRAKNIFRTLYKIILGIRADF